MIPAIGFVGPSGSGKTTLIEQIIPLLAAGGFRTGVLKHAHKGFEFDTPGKDSHRVREAGASQVLLVSSEGWVLMGQERGIRHEPLLARHLARFSAGEVDLVLVEGFHHDRFPKIEVFRPSHGQPPRCWPHDPDVIAVASDAIVSVQPPVVALDLNRPEVVTEFVREYVSAPPVTRRRRP